MPEGEVLEFSGVTKRFGAVEAVSGFSARVEPGQVTGFLGPNGAGKTTTLRILLGLVRATSGSATIGGKRYADLKHPMQTVGAVLEASSFHPGRSAANHLKVYAQAASLPKARVDEALAAVGLTEVAGRKVGGFSLGMRQRLGLAGALLGDPGVIVLDEPSNGLDPEGIIWMRSLLRELARQGRTVFVSSHLLTEIQQTADHLVIIARGRRVFQGAADELSEGSEHAVLVDSPDRAALAAALQSAGVAFETLRSGLTITGADPADIGRISFDAGVALSSLQRRGASLESVFLDLVNGVRTHSSGQDHRAEIGLGEPLAAAAVVEGSTEEAAPTVVEGSAEEAAPSDETSEIAEEQSVSADTTDPVIASDTVEQDAVVPDAAEQDAQEAELAASVSAEIADTANPSAGAPAFTVASTGVIDVVLAPELDEDSAPAATESTDPDSIEADGGVDHREDGTTEEGGDQR